MGRQQLPVDHHSDHHPLLLLLRRLGRLREQLRLRQLRRKLWLRLLSSLPYLGKGRTRVSGYAFALRPMAEDALGENA